MASTIIRQKPVAETGVRIGAIPVSHGTINPIAPSSSDNPINLTVAIEKSEAQGNCFSSFSFDWVDFVIPAT